MNPFNEEQSEMLSGLVKELNNVFADYSKTLMENVNDAIGGNNKIFDRELESILEQSKNQRKSFEDYCNRDILEVNANEKAAQARHEAYTKELRIASIATIYASGRGIDSAYTIIEQIEDKVNNPTN